MKKNYLIIARRDISSDELTRLANYRYKIFVERLGWTLPCDHNNRQELDQFDDLDHVYYVLQYDKTGCLSGFARLMPAEGPNLSRVVFPGLFGNKPLPSSPGAWELSRITIEKPQEEQKKDNRVDGTSLLDAILEFAEQQGIAYLYGVTYTVIRLLYVYHGFDVEQTGAVESCEKHRILGCRKILGCRVNVSSSLAARRNALSEKEKFRNPIYSARPQKNGYRQLAQA
jgi:N-acyl-L-homoserine lactone synthetase